MDYDYELSLKCQEDFARIERLFAQNSEEWANSVMNMVLFGNLCKIKELPKENRESLDYALIESEETRSALIVFEQALKDLLNSLENELMDEIHNRLLDFTEDKSDIEINALRERVKIGWSMVKRGAGAPMAQITSGIF